ncbi:hypothetical protein HDU85_000045 [Gaertneriomyces sp. JEL0708]|nr:hypothetical protein HDU85_000045 [Gaertneriomyces sp. JEL0708]
MTMMRRRSWLLVALVFCLTAGATAASSKWTPKQALIGVHPSKRGQYTTTSALESFKCLDGSKTIKFAAVNDDYCDCPDGSDEPGTAACENSRFHCINEDYIGENILSSRVNDGVCDCCDGSDEYAGYKACPNTCREVGEAFRKKQAAQQKALDDGVKLAREYSAYGMKQAEERTAKIGELERELTKLDAKIKTLSEVHAAAHAQKKQMTGKCCKAKKACKKALNSQLDMNFAVSERWEFITDNGIFYLDNVNDPDALRREDPLFGKAWDRWLLFSQKYGEEEDPDVEPVDDSQMDCCEILATCRKALDAERAALLKTKEKIRAAERVLQVLSSVAEKTRTNDEWVRRTFDKWVDYAHRYDNDQNPLPALPDIKFLDEIEEDDVIPTTTLLGSIWERVKEYTMRALDLLPVDVDEIIQFVRSSLGKPVTVDEEDEILRRSPSKASVRLEKAQQRRRDVQYELNELKEKQNMSFGPHAVWEKLYKHCVEYDTPEYTYELCHLDRITQKPKNGGISQNLGRFKRWGPRDESQADPNHSYQVMYYGDGASCWQGPQRSVEVTLECGAETTILSLSEKSKCEYSAVLRTPAACTIPATK